WRLSMRGSRICTARAPRSRARRPASAPWRPQPIASAGAGPARAAASPGPNACRAPGKRRGASQRQGARGASSGRRGESRPRAPARASAWRTLPALPSGSSQAVVDAFRSMRDINSFRAGFGKPLLQHSTLRPTRGLVPQPDPLARTMSQPLNEAALDQLFRSARTYNAFTGEVSDDTLRRLYDLLKLGPTGANTTPARFVFVKSAEAKAKLAPALSEGNHAKTMSAPVTVIVGRDLDFHEKLPYLFPHADAKAWFDGPREGRDKPSLLNMSLQAGYLILAARALGLDAGPMTGFDPAKVDDAFLENVLSLGRAHRLRRRTRSRHGKPQGVPPCARSCSPSPWPSSPVLPPPPR